MSNPDWREARPSRPYGSEPRGRDPGTPPGAPRTPPAGARTPGRDPGSAERAGEVGGGRGDSRGSDPRGRDPGWTGRDSGPRRASGSGWDPGPPAWRDGDPGADAQTRRMPVPRGVRGDGSLPSEVRGDGSPRDKQQGVPGGRPPGSTPPTGTRVAMTQPSGIDDGAARGPGGPRDSRGRRSSPPPRGPGRTGRWGTLQGGLGVCIIVASAAVGAILTMVARSAPGFLLGLCVVAGTVTASLAVRPRAGRLIFPVPVLSYLVAALISGVVFERPADLSKTALAIDSAQWIADGFFAMALATLLAVVITAARWFRWRRGRPTAGDPAGRSPRPTPAELAPPGLLPPGMAPPGPAPPGLALSGLAARDAMAPHGSRGRASRPRNPGIPRASRARIGAGRAGRPPALGVPGFLEVPGFPRAPEAGAILACSAPALARARLPGRNPTTSPAGHSGAPGA